MRWLWRRAAVLQRQRGEEGGPHGSRQRLARPAQLMRAMSSCRQARSSTRSAGRSGSKREGGRRGSVARVAVIEAALPGSSAPAQFRRDGSGSSACSVSGASLCVGADSGTAASCGGVRHHPRSRGGRPLCGPPRREAATTRRARYLSAQRSRCGCALLRRGGASCRPRTLVVAVEETHCESPSAARMCVQMRSRNQRSCDDHQRAAGELEQRLFERAQRFHVEVVRGFVQQQHVAAAAPASWPGAGGRVHRRRGWPTSFCWSLPLKLKRPR